MLGTVNHQLAHYESAFFMILSHMFRLPNPLPPLTDDYDGIIGNDSFSFVVIDSVGKFSVPGIMNTKIRTPIYAIASTDQPNTVQGLCSGFKVSIRALGIMIYFRQCYLHCRSMGEMLL
jgi:hypothetical protein